MTEDEVTERKVRPYLPLVVLLALGLAVGWGCGGGSSRGALELVPADASIVNVVNVERVRSEATDDVLNGVEEAWEEVTLEDIGFSFHDLKTLVEVFGIEYGDVLILEGESDSERIREELGDRGFGQTLYEGYIVSERGPGMSIALVGDRSQAVVGNLRGVKGVLGTLSDGIGILDDDNALARVLDRGREGWSFAAISDDYWQNCTGIMGLGGCSAMGVTLSKSAEGYLQETLFLFRSEQEAEAGLDVLDAANRASRTGALEMEVERLGDGGALIVMFEGTDENYIQNDILSLISKFDSIFGGGIR